MQLLKASKEAILKPIQTVAGIVESRNTVPILVNVLLTKSADQLSVLATDLEVQITTHANIGVGLEQIATTVAARKLLDILRALPDGAEVEITQEDEQLMIRSGGSYYKLQTLPGADYPVMKKPESWNVSFAMPQRTLHKLLGQVHFAMADKDIRFYLNGVFLEFKGSLLTAVATDGHRLAHTAQNLDGLNDADMSVIVPRKTVHELQRLLDDSDELVTVSLTDRQISFSFGDVELVSKLIEGRFPDYKRVIPTGLPIGFDIERESFLGALRRSVILLAADKKEQKGVKLHIENNILRLQAHNSEQEESIEEVAVEYADSPIDTAFKVAYLQDVLAMAKSEKIHWACAKEPGSAAVVTLLDDEHFCYVVMPMRV